MPDDTFSRMRLFASAPFSLSVNRQSCEFSSVDEVASLSAAMVRAHWPALGPVIWPKLVWRDGYEKLGHPCGPLLTRARGS